MEALLEVITDHVAALEREALDRGARLTPLETLSRAVPAGAGVELPDRDHGHRQSIGHVEPVPLAAGLLAYSIFVEPEIGQRPTGW
jgi:hypothetical protein